MTPTRPAHREQPPTVGRLARQTLLNALVTTAVAGPMAMRGVSQGNQANGAVTVTTVQLGTGVEQAAPFVRMSADSSKGRHESTTAEPAFMH
ncbi:hypothetical protein [Streptomyces sp. SLBN-8D4]|jgi:hypothetical protein|uniref:hypothetical protein n=1 Tax=Streptomyces sp. SLBN-8D4 TaxID=3377728 RepID=UPI003C7C2552